MSNLARQLAPRPFKGYLQVVKIKDGKIENLENLKYENIENIEKYIKQTDIYIAVNSSFNGKRGSKNLKNLRAFYLDFDLHKVSKLKLLDEINCIIAKTWLIADNGEIPRPTKAIVTGRGVHIYWDIEPSSYGALATWQELEDYLYNKLKHLGADKQATDSARVLRLVDTINSKSNTKCYMYVWEKNNIYSMYDLREEYLNWNNRHKKNYIKNNSNVGKKINYFNSYTLHLARANDIVKLVQLRKGNVIGYRNFILHCYAYWKGIYIRNSEELREIVYDLNNRFKVPLKEREVDAILRCIPKAINKFLEYEQGIRSGQAKRVSKEMKTKGGYWYKNITLIERLDITEKEQRNLETIIGRAIKYDRRKENDKIYQRNKRRNEKGLTTREQEKQNIIKEIKILKEQGLKQREIAEKLGKSVRTIKVYWNL